MRCANCGCVIIGSVRHDVGCDADFCSAVCNEKFVESMRDKFSAHKSAMDVQVAGSHYKDMPIQPIEFCHKNKLGACETLAIKYICRHKRKNGAEDIRKAIHCLELLLELEYQRPSDH